MTIAVGDRIPEATLQVMGENGPHRYHHRMKSSPARSVVLFAVPGAFTPGLLDDAPARLRRQRRQDPATSGVDTIACLSVNDAFVMDAWGKAQNAENILMLADGNGDFTSDLGLELDGRGFGMGVRSQRYAMIVDDGTVTLLNVEARPVASTSAPRKTILAAL
jgi:peroxiredoxin